MAIDTAITTIKMANPYGNNNGAGPDPLAQGVIAWSLGTDGCLGTKRAVESTRTSTNSDDVISWHDCQLFRLQSAIENLKSKIPMRV